LVADEISTSELLVAVKHECVIDAAPTEYTSVPVIDSLNISFFREAPTEFVPK
jgi:hypothetical protein